MTDTTHNNLVKRLRLGACALEIEQAADRIEELEAENNLMKTSGIIEVAVRNRSVMEYVQHWEGRAEAAEAKLAKAVTFAEIVERTGHGALWPLALDILAAIKDTPHD